MRVIITVQANDRDAIEKIIDSMLAQFRDTTCFGMKMRGNGWGYSFEIMPDANEA